MRRSADIIIAGAGLAGLHAAWHAARAGASVIMLCAGTGALTISGGCIDILGYVNGEPVSGHPLDAIALLPPEHPYRIIGAEAVRRALDEFMGLSAASGWTFLPARQGNHRVPTCMGTLKPTGLCASSLQPALLEQAGHVCVVGFEGMRDCQPSLVAGQLRRYAHLADKRFSEVLLPSPRQGKRSVTALDVARFLDGTEGRNWFISQMKTRLSGAGLMLLPSICGTRPTSAAWQALRDGLGCDVVEMLGMPPGVGGRRLRELYSLALRGQAVSLVENTTVTGAHSANGRCQAVVTAQGDVYGGKSFILATGGFLGGGIAAEPGRARERVFDLPVRAPEAVMDWSKPDVFASHPFASMGVAVNSRLNPLNGHGDALYENVHVAGRSLAGYNFVVEKSGNGVALSTGRYAAAQALGGE